MTDVISSSVESSPLQNKKSHKKEIILLLATLILVFVFGEVFFRFYYWSSGKIIAADDTELCFKEMKNPKSYSSVSPNVVFRNEFDEHPLIGIVPRKNSTTHFGKILQFSRTDPEGKLGPSLVYTPDYHNSQGLTNIENFSLQKPSNISKRIALFGDSFTCGAEQPLRFNMNYILKELVHDIEVLNFCVIGYGIDTMYARYVVESKPYNSDIVIFNVLVDDLRRAYGCPLFRPNLTISNGHLVIGPRKWDSLKDFYFNYSSPKYESYFIKHLLWTFNQHKIIQKDSDKGFKLFKVMVDELKIQTSEHNATLVIIPLLQENPSELETEIYGKIIELLKEKNVIFMDSLMYLASQKRTYNNQSLYYTRAKDKFSHFSQIGNAVFAQGLKKTLEDANLLQKTPNYFFANFQDFAFLYFIPEDLEMQIRGQIRILPAFITKNGSHSNSFNLSTKN